MVKANKLAWLAKKTTTTKWFDKNNDIWWRLVHKCGTYVVKSNMETPLLFDIGIRIMDVQDWGIFYAHTFSLCSAILLFLICTNDTKHVISQSRQTLWLLCWKRNVRWKTECKWNIPYQAIRLSLARFQWWVYNMYMYM